MKKVLILAVAIVMCASLAMAQTGGHIGLYSDTPGYSDCNLNEALYANNTVYVVHTTAAEGNTSQFMVTKTWAALAGAVSYFSNLTLGDIFTGITITYVGCKPLPHALASITSIPLAATPACTVAFTVVPDPVLVSGQIEVIDCSNNVLTATGGFLTVNGNGLDCPCVIVSTEESSWSQIKALYQ
jgi:hypothetical protein